MGRVILIRAGTAVPLLLASSLLSFLLVYWAPTETGDSILPPDAILLGALSGGRRRILPLPDPGMLQGGYLILYSGAYHRRVASGKLPRPGVQDGSAGP